MQMLLQLMQLLLMLLPLGVVNAAVSARCLTGSLLMLRLTESAELLLDFSEPDGCAALCHLLAATELLTQERSATLVPTPTPRCAQPSLCQTLTVPNPHCAKPLHTVLLAAVSLYHHTTSCCIVIPAHH